MLVPGKQVTIGADDYIQGVPELVVEVAASSAAIDLHDKKRAYRRNQVREYIVWRTLEDQLDWFRLEADEYVGQWVRSPLQSAPSTVPSEAGASTGAGGGA
ncbi:MAG: hypothetical protein OHK0047_33850 [Leptolyngbyaceae cyanobacterium]